MSNLALDTTDTVEDWLSVNRRRELSPEQELILAVLWDAVVLIQQTPKEGDAEKLKREACQWIRSNDLSWAFSFVNVCEGLSLDPECVRRAVF
jgi:hypothetical protein